jgi:hypothetical protein
VIKTCKTTEELKQVKSDTDIYKNDCAYKYTIIGERNTLQSNHKMHQCFVGCHAVRKTVFHIFLVYWFIDFSICLFTCMSHFE